MWSNLSGRASKIERPADSGGFFIFADVALERLRTPESCEACSESGVRQTRMELNRPVTRRAPLHWQRNRQGSATLPTANASQPGREIFQHRFPAQPFAEMRDVELRHVVAVRACRIERQPFLL